MSRRSRARKALYSPHARSATPRDYIATKRNLAKNPLLALLRRGVVPFARELQNITKARTPRDPAVCPQCKLTAGGDAALRPT